jgi:hypothetical protein
LICCANLCDWRHSNGACAGSLPSTVVLSGEQALRFVEEQLELYELEENVRVHEASRETRE